MVLSDRPLRGANSPISNIVLYGNILRAASGGSYLTFGTTSGSTGYGIRDLGTKVFGGPRR